MEHSIALCTSGKWVAEAEKRVETVSAGSIMMGKEHTDYTLNKKEVWCILEENIFSTPC